ncbi:glycosyltransferase involved in cell wall biosynthesis [Gramella sp. Hel_I_59]|uniref:glycosyltransferase family 2 protein n=1 Tax=Gramella sp. Hel_I_59 TaxID=1249978 RepID=UPI001154D7E9|nr:glycosyltransferase family 2 protein [Gramella sp. Hel_I_59]TQI71546.1 glycosyltransferase involved in cell wall biosynthesis [Gramella sp. Hel_I_59]
MDKRPLLTIITINKDNLQGLKRTVESVLEQTWQEFEYLVIDGASQDGTVEFLRSRNSGIDKFISEKDSGIYNAMNKGIKMANGKYVLFLNSGDHFLQIESLENTCQFLRSYDFIYFNLKVIMAQESFIKNYPDQLSFLYFLEDTLPHPSTFIRKAILENNGFYDENLKIISDWKFFLLSICRSNASYIHIDKTLSVFYLDGISSKEDNSEMIVEEKKEVLENFFPLFLNDYSELKKLKESLGELKKSRKIQILVKTGLLNKF